MKKSRSILTWIIMAVCIWISWDVVNGSAVLAGDILSRVRMNKEVRCGVTEPLPGFSMMDPNGRWQGFTIDFCRAVAAAALNDPNKVTFTPLSAPQRFPTLLLKRIDLLAHTTTWTFGRDVGIGIQYPGIYFYDGQTFMLPKDKKIQQVQNLAGATICVEKATTLQSNLADTFQARGIPYKPLVAESQEEMVKAFLDGRCQAITAEESVLAAIRSRIPGGLERFDILKEKISKEPLCPVVQRGDEEWLTLVRWVLFALIEAEELGVTSTNVKELQKNSTDPEIHWFLNASGQYGKAIGLKLDWTVDVIAAVGNYGEIFERNFGPASGLNIDRGLNRLWNQGGLLYAPPFQ
jgi:general L-amino acid transport system substrate-binding protein